MKAVVQSQARHSLTGILFRSVNLSSTVSQGAGCVVRDSVSCCSVELSVKPGQETSLS